MPGLGWAMSRARLVITAVVVEGRSQAEVARAYGVSKGWVSKLVARWRIEGDAAFEPRSRRPNTTPNATLPHVVELIVSLRTSLTQAGHDAGPGTISWHLRHHHHITIAESTIARVLSKAGLVAPAPRKRPKASWIRFQADAPNECWQADFTHYRLTDDTDVEILTFLDDHSRLAISITCHTPVTGKTVVTAFRDAIATHGEPASTLTDNGMVFTTRLATKTGGRCAFEVELANRGIQQKNSKPNHPTTCGKVERFQQTMKKWLHAQPNQPATVAQLEMLIARFKAEYNNTRPHKSLPHRATPTVIYTATTKATPNKNTTNEHDRIRRDIVDQFGKLSLRHAGKMHHIGLGRTHARTPVIVLIQDLEIRVVDAATGELLRELTLDKTRDYQGTGQPRRPPTNKKLPTH